MLKTEGQAIRSPLPKWLRQDDDDNDDDYDDADDDLAFTAEGIVSPHPPGISP